MDSSEHGHVSHAEANFQQISISHFCIIRAIGQYCPNLQEPHLSILCDALIQSCLKLQIHPKVTFNLLIH